MLGITKEALPLIEHYELLPTDNNGDFDLYAVIITNFRFVSSDCLSITMRHDFYYSSNNKEITFEIKNVFGKIELTNIFDETSFGLEVKRIFNTLQIHMTSLTKGYTILNIKAKSINVVKCECFDNNKIPFRE